MNIDCICKAQILQIRIQTILMTHCPTNMNMNIICKLHRKYLSKKMNIFIDFYVRVFMFFSVIYLGILTFKSVTAFYLIVVHFENVGVFQKILVVNLHSGFSLSDWPIWTDFVAENFRRCTLFFCKSY